jgi:hypothetical protein
MMIKLNGNEIEITRILQQIYPTFESPLAFLTSDPTSQVGRTHVYKAFKGVRIRIKPRYK